MRHCRYSFFLSYVGILWLLESNVFDSYPAVFPCIWSRFDFLYYSNQNLGVCTQNQTLIRLILHTPESVESNFLKTDLHLYFDNSRASMATKLRSIFCSASEDFGDLVERTERSPVENPVCIFHFNLSTPSLVRNSACLFSDWNTDSRHSDFVPKDLWYSRKVLLYYFATSSATISPWVLRKR